jgi:hypothetical protein
VLRIHEAGRSPDAEEEEDDDERRMMRNAERMKPKTQLNRKKTKCSTS